MDQADYEAEEKKGKKELVTESCVCVKKVVREKKIYETWERFNDRAEEK